MHTHAFHARECSSLCGMQQAVVVLPSEASLVQRIRAGSSDDFGRPSGTERARAPISSTPVEPSGPEDENVGKCFVFEQQGQAISSSLAELREFEWPSRAPQRSRLGSRDHVERPNGVEPARSQKRRQVLCFRSARPTDLIVYNVFPLSPNG